MLAVETSSSLAFFKFLIIVLLSFHHRHHQRHTNKHNKIARAAAAAAPNSCPNTCHFHSDDINCEQPIKHLWNTHGVAQINAQSPLYLFRKGGKKIWHRFSLVLLLLLLVYLCKNKVMIRFYLMSLNITCHQKWKMYSVTA